MVISHDTKFHPSVLLRVLILTEKVNLKHELFRSLNPANSLKIPAWISQDPRHGGSCQDLFKIFAYVLVTPVYRIFQGLTRSSPGFQQVPNKN